MQSQYTALLLIPTQHQLAQGLQEISPGREASCPELTRKEGKGAGSWREAPPSPSLPLGFPTGRQPLCVLHPSAGWLRMLSTISSWLEDTSASYWAMTCVVSSSALNERDVTFLGMNSLEMLCRSETDTPKTGFFSRCWPPETHQVQIKDGYIHCRQQMGWERTYNHSL